MIGKVYFKVFVTSAFLTVSLLVNSEVIKADNNQPSPPVIKVQQDSNQQTAASALKPKINYKIPAKYKYLFAESKTKETIPKIHLKEAKVLYESGKALFIDARGIGEYNISHIPGSESMGASEAATKIPLLKDKLQDKVLVTYCHGTGCHLSDKVAAALFDAGYRKICIFFGGWPEWTQANMPVQKYEPPAEYKYLFDEAASAGAVKKLTLTEAKFLYDNDLANFIDADDADKFNKMRIKWAYSIPADKTGDMLQSYSAILSQKPIVVYCRGFFNGNASKAAEKLFKAGYKKIHIFNNALSQWEKAGYPIDKAAEQGK